MICPDCHAPLRSKWNQGRNPRIAYLYLECANPKCGAKFKTQGTLKRVEMFVKDLPPTPLHS